MQYVVLMFCQLGVRSCGFFKWRSLVREKPPYGGMHASWKASGLLHSLGHTSLWQTNDPGFQTPQPESNQLYAMWRSSVRASIRVFKGQFAGINLVAVEICFFRVDEKAGPPGLSCLWGPKQIIVTVISHSLCDSIGVAEVYSRIYATI